MRGLVSTPVKNAIAVASGKGGVGKSTISVNLAVALAQSGARVGLMDADIYGPNIPTMMGAPRMPNPREDRLIPAESYGVKIMSMGYLVRPGQPLIWRGPMLNSAIRQFRAMWNGATWIISSLTCRPAPAMRRSRWRRRCRFGRGHRHPAAAGFAGRCLSRGLEMFRTLDDADSGRHREHELSHPAGWLAHGRLRAGRRRTDGATLRRAVPGRGSDEPAGAVGGDTGKPIVIADPESDAAKALRAIAEAVAARMSVLALTGNDAPTINVI